MNRNVALLSLLSNAHLITSPVVPVALPAAGAMYGEAGVVGSGPARLPSRQQRGIHASRDRT